MNHDANESQVYILKARCVSELYQYDVQQDILTSSTPVGAGALIFTQLAVEFQHQSIAFIESFTNLQIGGVNSPVPRYLIALLVTGVP